MFIYINNPCLYTTAKDTRVTAGILPNASFSRMSVYENCPRQYKLKYIDLLPEPERPVKLDRSGKPKPSAAERGSWIHESMDDYINGKMENMLPELLNIRDQVNELKSLKSSDKATVHTEEKWYFDLDWEPIKTEADAKVKEYAVIVIIDAMVIDDQTDPDFVTARIIDLKSGKSYNNALKHAKQLNLYAAAAATKFPDIQEFSLELLYCDEGKHVVRQITREHALTYRNYWDVRIMELVKDNFFDARPSASNCRFCCRRPEDKPNKWVNGDGTCDEFVEHPNDTKGRK